MPRGKERTYVYKMQAMLSKEEFDAVQKYMQDTGITSESNASRLLIVRGLKVYAKEKAHMAIFAEDPNPLVFTKADGKKIIGIQQNAFKNAKK